MKMRRWLAAFLSICVLVVGAVPALALNGVLDFMDINGTDARVGPFLTKGISSEAQQFYKDFFSTDKPKLIYYENNAIMFIVLDDYQSADDVTLINSNQIHIKCAYRCITFLSSPAKSALEFSLLFSRERGYHVYSGYVLGRVLCSSVPVSSSLSPFCDNVVNLVCFDNAGLVPEPEPEPDPKPDPDPEPEPEPPPFIPPSKPVVPSIQNDYITYDTTRWNGFFDWISASIGNSVNTGLVIFTFILGIYVVIRVVKKFTS